MREGKGWLGCSCEGEGEEGRRDEQLKEVWGKHGRGGGDELGKWRRLSGGKSYVERKC